MNQILHIATLCNSVIKETGTRNPFEVAEALDVRVQFCPDFQKLKGMYKVILHQPFIFLNGNLRRREAREILAHELGHHILHREMGENSVVQDSFIMDMTLKPEYEANLFAAQLLIDEKTFLSLLTQGYSIGEAVRLLKVSLPLAELKLRILREEKKLP